MTNGQAEGAELPGGGTAASGAGSGGLALARAGLVVSGAYLASRVLGYVRVLVIGSTLGASPDTDAFLAAFRIPDLIFQLVAAGTVAAALVPMVAGELGTGRAGRAWHIVSTIASLMTVGLVILAGFAWVAAPVLVPYLAPGYAGAQLQQTIDLTRMMLLAPMFLALGAVASSALNAHNRFAAAAIAPIVYNLAIIGAAIILTPTFGVAGLAIGVVAGSLGHLLVQVPPLARAGFRFTPNLDVSDPDVRQALRLMGPRTVALGATQITFLVATALATGLATGSVTAFTFAFTVFSIPLSVIGVPLGIVALPTLSRDLARGAVDEFASLLSRGVRLILFLLLPLVALGIALRAPATTLLFNHGRFTAESADLVASALLFLLLALPGEGLNTILVRAFYADRDTRTPALAAILGVILNVAIGVTAVRLLGWGLPGIGFGIAVGSTVEAALLAVLLRRRIPAFDPSPILRLGAPVAVASLAAGLVAAGVVSFAEPALLGAQSSVRAFVELALGGGAGAFAYLFLARALRLPELGVIMRLMSDTLSRLRPA
ncbi:MAG TPA: murein biosynthesis integral membrane protein MurJ [Patescibacteria group bacterium]|nr:murein biosynthesis integral membrane protein MurJ [Patescibacteria group bacterium]